MKKYEECATRLENRGDAPPKNAIPTSKYGLVVQV